MPVKKCVLQLPSSSVHILVVSTFSPQARPALPWLSGPIFFLMCLTQPGKQHETKVGKDRAVTWRSTKREAEKHPGGDTRWDIKESTTFSLISQECKGTPSQCTHFGAWGNASGMQSSLPAPELEIWQKNKPVKKEDRQNKVNWLGAIWDIKLKPLVV